MRGHWLSTTRKLNKHYQDGGGGITPPPEWSWEKFLTGGAKIPAFFFHDIEHASPYQENTFYNRIYTHSTNTGGYYGGYSVTNSNYAKVYPWLGPVNHRKDYMNASGYEAQYASDFDPSVDYDFYKWYTDASLDHKRPIPDPDYLNTPSFYDSGSNYKTNTYNLYKDMGARFVKFHNPLYGYAPGVFRDGTAYSNGVGESEIIYTGVRLSAKACKEAAENCYIDNGSYMHMRTFCSYYDEGSLFSAEIISSQLYDTGQIYDLEQSGISYLESTGKVSLRINGVYQALYKLRVYLFIHGGDYYVDQLVHLIDDNGDEVDIGKEIFLSSFGFPAILMGFLSISEYNQGSSSYYLYPSPMKYPGNTGYEVDAQSNGDFYRMNLIEACTYPAYNDLVDPPVILSYTNKWSFRNDNYMQIKIIDANEFWNAEADWHLQHGGTPYLTP